MNTRILTEILCWDSAETSPIAAQVEQALRKTGQPPLRNVRALAILSVVQLQGTVSSYHLKQLAQVAALSVKGVSELKNEVEVVSAR